MPLFHYVGFNAQGKREEGEISFATEAQAYDSLSGLGVTVVELAVKKQGGNKKARGASLFGEKISLETQAELAEQLSVLFAARLPVTEIVDVVEAGSERPAVQKHFARLGKLLADGVDFPQAFERAGGEFQPVFVSLLKIGQSSSDLAPMLRSLAAYLRRQEKLRSQLVGALVYPVILVLAAILVFLLMVFYLAPNLTPMFTSLDRPIPGSLALFLDFGQALRQYGAVLGFVLIALLGVLALALRSPRAAFELKVRALRLPIWGSIAKTASLARMTRALELMLTSGTPLAPALRDCATLLDGEVFAPVFGKAAEAVELGDNASQVFADDPNISAIFRELFKLGEQTNALPAIMTSLAAAMEDRLERQTQRVVGLITPIMTLVVGGGIAFLVYSVMGAILSVNDLAF